MTQKELREKIRIEERRKCRMGIEELKAKNRKLLHENINLRTDNSTLRMRHVSTKSSSQDWFIKLTCLYGR